jgi:3-oxoacyl-[acyl-carrier protein] reductase
MGKLDNQVAIVTGGGTGIGRGVAIALAGEGARVVVCGRRKEPLEETASAIRARGGEALAVQADVTDERDVNQTIQATLDAYGRIDLLVNNAGISGGDPIQRHDVKDWDQVMDINLRGSFLMARAVLPAMRMQRKGHIINISSESGLEYYPGDGSYGVSKHA